MRTFKIDVTPPVGDYLCGGLHDTSQGVETSLYLRGVIVSANETYYVIGCVDYCYLRGRSQIRFVESLALGAGVPVDQVTLHSNHVHDAPLVDEEGHATVSEYHPEIQFHNEQYFSQVLSDVKKAVKAALSEPGIPIVKVAFSSHAVKQFGSRRPVVDEDGLRHIRWSICRDPFVRDQSVGLIDPNLDQVNYYGEDGRPVVSLNFYASHPQVSDGRRLVSSDVVGVALDAFKHKNPGVFAIYFTGCAGNVTAGKYSTADRQQNRQVFGNRLFDAMQYAFEKSNPVPIASIGWKDSSEHISLSRIDEDQGYFVQVIKSSSSNRDKYLAALKLNRLRSQVSSYPFRISRLIINDINVLFMPSELCVEYQIYSKLHCDGDLAVAAYGDCYLNYVAIDSAFDQGGYEVRPQWTEVEKGIEIEIKRQIDRSLAWKPEETLSEFSDVVKTKVV